MSLYNPNVPLETALEMFDDPHIRHDIIESYHDAMVYERLADTALEAVVAPEEIATPAELLDAYASSEFGQTLKSQTRFGVFKPDWCSTELWCDVLGPDVNNLDHMSHTLRLTELFCDGEQVDLATRDKLTTTAITHDWGEAIIGDIPLPNKTGEDEKREETAYREIATRLLGEDAGRELSDTVWSVLSHEDEATGDMFKAIEYLGYCTTAIRAGNAALRIAHGFDVLPITRDQKDQLISALFGLRFAVEIGNFATMKAFVAKYPSLTQIIKEVQ